MNLRDRIPKDPNVDYMVAPPEGSLEQQSKGVILYCIDVSTSMGSTFRIPSLQGKARCSSIKRYLYVYIKYHYLDLCHAVILYCKPVYLYMKTKLRLLYFAIICIMM